MIRQRRNGGICVCTKPITEPTAGILYAIDVSGEGPVLVYLTTCHDPKLGEIHVQPGSHSLCRKGLHQVIHSVEQGYAHTAPDSNRLWHFAIAEQESFLQLLEYCYQWSSRIIDVANDIRAVLANKRAEDIFVGTVTSRPVAKSVQKMTMRKPEYNAVVARIRNDHFNSKVFVPYVIHPTDDPDFICLERGTSGGVDQRYVSASQTKTFGVDLIVPTSVGVGIVRHGSIFVDLLDDIINFKGRGGKVTVSRVCDIVTGELIKSGSWYGDGVVKIRALLATGGSLRTEKNLQIFQSNVQNVLAVKSVPCSTRLF
jgi:hypothetical protein